MWKVVYWMLKWFFWYMEVLEVDMYKIKIVVFYCSFKQCGFGYLVVGEVLIQILQVFKDSVYSN